MGRYASSASCNERLELSLSASFTCQRAGYSLRVGGDVYRRPPGRWVLSADIYFTATTGLAASYRQRVLHWNAGLACLLSTHK